MNEVLDFYATPGRFTTLPDGCPVSADVARVVEIVQGLLVYDVVAEVMYGTALGPDQADAIHERDTARLLDLARAIDPRPLTEAREPADRVGARCHAFSRVTVALLRGAGVPARARCGFATYFGTGWYEDHWVAEYWTDDGWRMVDAQLDGAWRELVGFAGDPLAITGDQFVTAGHAWQAWRRGDLDADRCGLSGIPEGGTHWIAGNLRLDLAALNKVEMLPWDVWGDGWEPDGDGPTAGQLERFDAIAALTVDPDSHFDALRDRYDTDDLVRMGGTVFNALRQRTETIDRES